MNYFSSNLKSLRAKKGLNQAEIKDYLGFPRTTWSSYEQGASQPNIDEILRIANFFNVDVTSLLSYDLSETTPNGEKNKQQKTTPKSIPITTPNGENFLPKVITVDVQGNENITFVPIKAKAGYLLGYGDSEFIETLPTYRIPGLHSGTFRAFEIDGHSMIPTFQESDIVIGRFVEKLSDIRDDRVYIVVSKNDGVVIKRVINRVQRDGKLILNSDNQRHVGEYPPIVINPEEVLEIWYVMMRITRQMPRPSEFYTRLIDVESRLTLLEEGHHKPNF